MKVKDIYNLTKKEGCLTDKEVKELNYFITLLSPISQESVQRFKHSWDYSRPEEEYYEEVKSLIKKLLNIETSSFGREVRNHLKMPPLSLEGDYV